MYLSDMTSKTALITGSTAGIGMETARGLAKQGASVILVGIDHTQAQQAAQDIRISAGHDRVSAFAADLTSLQGLLQLGSQIAERYEALDVLVNNVGMNRPHRELTADGVEKMFAAHVLTPFTLTHLLLPQMKRAGHARVVNLTGGIPGGSIEQDNLLGERRFIGWTFSHYNHTKTMTMALTARLARELRDTGVTANVVYPGHGYTPMNKSTPITAFPKLYRPIAPLVLKVVAPLFLSDLTRSARSSIYLAASPEVEGLTGAYFDDKCRRKPLPASALDERNQNAIWDLCVRLSADALTATQT